MTLPRLVLTREQLRSLRWEGGCPDCQGEGWLDDETRCLCLCSEATVTLAERPVIPCPFDGVWSYRDSTYTLPCPKCGDLLGVHRDITIPIGTRVEVGWSEPWLRHNPVWQPVATGTVAEVTPWETDEDLPWTYRVTLTDIEATP